MSLAVEKMSLTTKDVRFAVPRRTPGFADPGAVSLAFDNRGSAEANSSGGFWRAAFGKSCLPTSRSVAEISSPFSRSVFCSAEETTSKSAGPHSCRQNRTRTLIRAPRNRLSSVLEQIGLLEMKSCAQTPTSVSYDRTLDELEGYARRTSSAFAPSKPSHSS